MIKRVFLDNKFEFGIKRTCRSCGVNFYDLDKHPSECPNCGAIYELHVSSRVRRSKDYVEQDMHLDLPFEIEDTLFDEETVGEVGLTEDDPFDGVSINGETD